MKILTSPKMSPQNSTLDPEVEAEIALLRASLTFDEAITALANYRLFSRRLKIDIATDKARAEQMLDSAIASIEEMAAQTFKACDIAEHSQEEIQEMRASGKSRAKLAADALHDKPGGNREKRAAIQVLWASGKYTSRDICAEQEGGALGMSVSTARKALRGTPNPT